MTRKTLTDQPVIDDFFGRRGDHRIVYDAGLLDLEEHPRFGVVQVKVHVYTNPGVFFVMLIGCDEAVDMMTMMTPKTLEKVRDHLTEGFKIDPDTLTHLRFGAVAEQEEDMLSLEVLPDV